MFIYRLNVCIRHLINDLLARDWFEAKISWQYIVSDLTHPFYKAKRFLQNVWAYRKILLHDEDFDFAYLLEIMAFKMRAMSDCIRSNQIVMNADKYANTLAVAAFLADRLNTHRYTVEEMLQGREQADLKELCYIIENNLFTWWD